MKSIVRTARRGLIAAIGLCLLVLGPAGADPTIAISGPAAGSVIDRSQTPQMTVTGTAAFDAPVPSSKTLFARRDGCAGASTDDPRLMPQQGSDAGDGCGHIVGPVANTQNLAYPAKGGLPVILDARRPLTGAVTIHNSHTSGVQRPALGSVNLTATVTATIAGNETAIGSKTDQLIFTPAEQAITKTFEFQLDPALQGKTLSALTLTVRMEGPGVSLAVKHSGTTFVVVPTLDPGAVFVGVGSSTAKPTTPIEAVVRSDGTWEATVSTPFPGQKRIHARAVQGQTEVWATSVPVTVVS